MAVPYYILGIIYIVGLLCTVAFFFFNLYHLRRFGFFDFTAFVITMLTMIVMGLMMVFSIIFLVNVNWTDSAELFDNSVTDAINF